jgi:hypothetical protein
VKWGKVRPKIARAISTIFTNASLSLHVLSPKSMLDAHIIWNNHRFVTYLTYLAVAHWRATGSHYLDQKSTSHARVCVRIRVVCQTPDPGITCVRWPLLHFRSRHRFKDPMQVQVLYRYSQLLGHKNVMIMPNTDNGHVTVCKLRARVIAS